MTAEDPGAMASPAHETMLLVPDQFAAAEFANPLFAQVSSTQHSPAMPPLMARKEASRWSVLLWGLLILVVIAAIVAYFVFPRADHRYVKDLKSAGLLSQYPSEDAAITHGRAFCTGLDAGQSARGTAAELIAVEVYCPSHETGFTVVPTPQQQKTTYLNLIKAGGFSDTFRSIPAALSHAQAVCTALQAGGKRRGHAVDRIAVQVYCPTYLSGYRVTK